MTWGAKVWREGLEDGAWGGSRPDGMPPPLVGAFVANAMVCVAVPTRGASSKKNLYDTYHQPKALIFFEKRETTDIFKIPP